MLLQIGPLQFSIAPMNVHEVERQSETDYAKKEVVGRRKIYEFVGEGTETLTLEGKLFPLKTGGAGALQLLNNMRQSGSPQYCMRGDGYAMGWHVITKVREVNKHLSPDGVGQEIDVTITLERADSPGALAAFTQLFSLAP